MTSILNQRPAIGIAGGLTSGILYALKELFTNDVILKWVAGLGIWMGLFIAMLTVWLRIIEIKRQKQTLD